MNENRRAFLLGGPAVFFGLEQLTECALAQADRGGAVISPEVTDFWKRGMGVPSDMLVGGGSSRARRPAAGPGGGDFAREPLFLHYDADDKVLIPATEIPLEKLSASGDVKVDFQMVRLRLNADDNREFQNFSSGGIYLDFQQSQTTSSPANSSSGSEVLVTLASSIFSAIFPNGNGGSGADGTGGGTKGGGGKKGGKGLPFVPQSQTQGRNPAAPAATVQLQQAKQSQSIALAAGVGKTAFACFAKGRKKTAFGQFVSALLTVSSSPAMTYLPLLSMPLVATPTLTAIRALVGNLQSHGGDERSILQSPPVDVAATAEGIKTLNSSALRLRSGHYIVIPQEHAGLIKSQLNNLKVLNGFLVPKEAGELDVFDAVPRTATGVSYLSLDIGVSKTKLSNCVAQAGR